MKIVRVLSLFSLTVLCSLGCAAATDDEDPADEVDSELSTLRWKTCKDERGSVELPGYYGKTLRTKVSVGYRQYMNGFKIFAVRATVENPFGKDANDVNLYYVSPQTRGRHSFYASGDKFPSGKEVTLKLPAPEFVPPGAKVVANTIWDKSLLDMRNDNGDCSMQF